MKYHFTIALNFFQPNTIEDLPPGGFWIFTKVFFIGLVIFSGEGYTKVSGLL
jgi:hypothetical protein